MDTNTVNPTTTTAVTRRPRIKDALAIGIIDSTQAGVQIISSTADVVQACAVRIKLHNVSTAADILDEFGVEKVTQAQALIAGL